MFCKTRTRSLRFWIVIAVAITAASMSSSKHEAKHRPEQGNEHGADAAPLSHRIRVVMTLA